jgi:hypothetical protein
LDFAGDQPPLYEADLDGAGAPGRRPRGSTADEPGDVRHGFVPYEDWLRLNWERPDLYHRLGYVRAAAEWRYSKPL